MATFATTGRKVPLADMDPRLVPVRGGQYVPVEGELDPELVWLSHAHEPWRPQVDQHL